ncbi:hypothetical protein SAMN06264855_1172 [Halorubrum vacuolatum]|uniref:DUF1102 domain-containing protein n=2 Tax=Halorubrum vacuolatum TaxID=63740 RepID=A0A238XFH1_HALVU|nr:hypothetical protein SAMN06264855_1172 [Halorubrum vacuolatum]
MIPQGKLLALALVFAAVIGLAGTGAFTTVEADRTADVEVAGDAEALLGLQATDDSPFADMDDEQLILTLDEDDAEDGEGLNVRATTYGADAFTVTNQGSEDGIEIGFDFEEGDAADNIYFVVDDGDEEDSGDELGFEEGFDLERDSVVPKGDLEVVGAADDSEDTATIELDPGESVDIGIIYEIDDPDDDDFDDFDDFEEEEVFDDDLVTITADGTE